MIPNANFKKKWESEKSSEIEFWRSWFKTKGLDWPHDYNHRMDPNADFQERLAKCLPKQRDVSILDVGAGPLTKLWKVCPMHNLDITAVDALADDYDKLLMEFGIVPLVRTQSCDVEKLLDIFQFNSFDLVYMCNTLDHSYDAVEGINQMLGVVKLGCYVLLDHAINEAENANYGGLHQCS